MSTAQYLPADWEQIGHELWDDLTAIASRDERRAAAVARAARYTIQTEIEKGQNDMDPNPLHAALEKVLRLRAAYRLKSKMLALFYGVSRALGVDGPSAPNWGNLAKAAAGADPAALVRALQALRDQLELSGDTLTAGQVSEAIGLVVQAQGATPATKLQKRAPAPAVSQVMKEQAQRLRQLANTDPNSQRRAEYQRQYNALPKEYR